MTAENGLMDDSIPRGMRHQPALDQACCTRLTECPRYLSRVSESGRQPATIPLVVSWLGQTTSTLARDSAPVIQRHRGQGQRRLGSLLCQNQGSAFSRLSSEQGLFQGPCA